MSASALHHRAHVVVIDEPHALGERGRRHLGHPVAELLPTALGHHRPLRQRPGDIAMDGVGGFGEHQHRAAQRLQQVEMRAQRRQFGGGVAPEQLAGIPARHEAEPEARQHLLQGRRLRGNLCPISMPWKPTLLASFEAGLKRNVGSQLLHVVVRPADGIGADADGHLDFLLTRSPPAGRWQPRSARARQPPAAAAKLREPPRPTRRRRPRCWRRHRCR